jgi:hypothetical protein
LKTPTPWRALSSTSGTPPASQALKRGPVAGAKWGQYSAQPKRVKRTDAVGRGLRQVPDWVQLANRLCKTSVRPWEVHVGRRGRRRGSRGRAEDRVRGRVRERMRGSQGRGEGGARWQRGTLDVGTIEGYANRLGNRVGGTSGLAEAASGLAGAASGLGVGSVAHRILGSNTESSEEDFGKEVRERLDLIDERLERLEDQMHKLREAGGREGDPGGGLDSSSNR